MIDFTEKQILSDYTDVETLLDHMRQGLMISVNSSEDGQRSGSERLFL